MALHGEDGLMPRIQTAKSMHNAEMNLESPQVREVIFVFPFLSATRSAKISRRCKAEALCSPLPIPPFFPYIARAVREGGYGDKWASE